MKGLVAMESKAPNAFEDKAGNMTSRMGEADPDDSILREKAREAIRVGKLPNRHPFRMWGGQGVGAQCMVCGASVKGDEVGLEIEFIGDGGTGASNHHFHIRCYSALEFELHNLELTRRAIHTGDQTQSATVGAPAGGPQSAT